MKKIILTVPVYNEEKVLETAIIRLHNYMHETLKINGKYLLQIMHQQTKQKKLKII